MNGLKFKNRIKKKDLYFYFGLITIFALISFLGKEVLSYLPVVMGIVWVIGMYQGFGPSKYRYRSFFEEGNRNIKSLKFGEAITSYSKAIKIYKKDPILYNNRSVAYRELGNIKDAYLDINEALELDPRCVLAICSLGNIQQQEGKYKDAIQSFKKATTIEPNQPDAYFYLYQIYLELKETDLAVTYLKQASELGDVEATERLDEINKTQVHTYSEDYSIEDNVESDLKRLKDFAKQKLEGPNSQWVKFVIDEIKETIKLIIGKEGYEWLGDSQDNIPAWQYEAVSAVTTSLYDVYHSEGKEAAIGYLSENLEIFEKFEEYDSDLKLFNLLQLGGWKGLAVLIDLIEEDKSIDESFEIAREISELAGEGYQRTSSEDDYISIAEQQNSQGEQDKAIASLTKAIEIDPKCVLAYSNRGCIKANLGDLKSAIIDWDKAIEIDNTYSFAFYNRAKAKSQIGDIEGEIEDYSCVIDLDPENASAYQLRAEAKRLINDNEGAINDYNEAIKLDPTNSQFFLGRGLGRQGLTNYSEAIYDFNQSIELDPNNDSAYTARGKAKIFSKDDFKGAILDFNEAIKLNPNNALAYSHRGSAKQFISDKNGAISDLKKAIELGYKDAIELLNEVLETNQEAFSLMTSGMEKLYNGNLQGSIYDLTKAIQKEPKFSDAYSLRAEAKRGLDDNIGALEDFSTAIKLNPNNEQDYYNLANIYAGIAGEEEKAIMNYTKAIDLKPDYDLAIGNRGMCKYKLGRKLEAIKDLDKAIEINPKSYINYNNRGFVQSELANYDAAISDHQKAISLNAEYAPAYYNCGLAKAHLNDMDEACIYWKQASDMGDKNAASCLDKFCK